MKKKLIAILIGLAVTALTLFVAYGTALACIGTEDC